MIFTSTGQFLTRIGGFASSNGAEISAFDPGSDRLFLVAGNVVEILDLADPTSPTKIGDLALNFDGLPPSFSPVPNSVAVGKAGTPSAGVIAVALAVRDDLNNQEAGQIQFFDATTGNFLGKVLVGFLPDMVTFSPDGTKVLVANEGEPNESYTVDPVGSVSIVDITGGFANPVAQTATFDSFNSQKADLKSAGVKLFGQIFDDNGALVRESTVAEDLEPEYIAFNGDGTKAWVTLQENNAFAVIDIATATVEAILPLGFKDYSLPGNGLDASDRDGGINIQNWPIFGMYMPDSIASFTVGDQTYYITANEGDARNRPSDDDILPAPFDEEGDIFSGEARIKDLILDPVAFPNAAELQADSAIGRLTVTTKLGDIDGDGDFDQLYAFGSRSFSIWGSDGNLVYDSGDDLERITAAVFPDFFNASNSNNNFDNRSDDKGPEPEGITVGTIGDRHFAFVGLERIGGVMVYEVTNPQQPKFLQYINPRNFAEDPESGLTDSGPEGLTFINAADSPNGQNLLVATNEVSNTISVFEFVPPPIFNPIGTFTTPQLIGLDGYTVDPIFTVGEADPNTNYAPPGILDGLGAFALDHDTVRVLANSELPADAGYAYQLANGTSLTGARVSYFDINTESREVEGAGLAYDTIINRAGEVVDSADDLEFGGLNRLCSAQYIEAGQFAGRGLVDGMFFTGEESNGGTEYVLDPTSNTLYAVPWMGVAAWENVTELDTGTTDKVALLIGDDRGGAPLLLYVGDKGQGEGPEFLVRNGLAQGKLYVWVASTGETTPEEFNGTGQSRGGSFVEIDHYSPELAGTEGYDVLGFATQEKQDALAAEAGAFKFSRPEDLATSPTDGTVAVLASTGRDSLFPSDSWGTTYLIDADFSDLTNITADINAIYDGDDAGAGQFAGPDFGLRSPDNLEWADDGQIYIQEDRSIDGFGLTSGEEASIWRLDPNTGLLTRVGQINRDAVPEGQVDGAPTDIGNWESSGIIDVSSLFGESAGSLFLFDIQAHSLGGGIIEDAGLVQGGQLAFLSVDPVDPIANEIGVLAEDGFFFIQLPDGSEVEVKFQNQPFAANTFGNWQILEAEIVGGINQILWQNPDTNEIGTWNADANWNWVSSETWSANSFKTLEAEVTFQIDLNDDELLGDRLTFIENEGSTSFLEGIFGNYYTRTADNLTTPIKFAGEVFDNVFGDWQGLAAETIEGVNQVLFENQTTNQVGVWNTDATWNWISSSVFATGSPEAIAQSAIFGVDVSGSTVA